MCQLYRGVCHVVRGMHTLNVSIASLFELHFTTRTRMVLNWTLGGRPKCSTEYSNETFSCYYIFDWERLQLKNTNKRTADTLRFISSGGNACAHWFYMYISCFSTFFFIWCHSHTLSVKCLNSRRHIRAEIRGQLHSSVKAVETEKLVPFPEAIAFLFCKSSLGIFVLNHCYLFSLNH